MKPSIYRRIRRRSSNMEAASFKKENQQEQSFFGETMQEPFFKPVTVVQQGATVQRKCADCENEEKKVQKKSDGMEKKEEEKKLQKKSDGMEKKEDEKKLQKKSDNKEKKAEDKKLQKKETGTANTGATSVAGYVNNLHGKGTSMPTSTLQFFGQRMGYDFSHVKIHTDKDAADSAKAVHAKAYAVGNHIVFNEGQFNQESAEGKKLMAHELVHVIQQENEQMISKQEETEKKEEPECKNQTLDLEAETNATYNKGAGTAINEVTKKGKGCDGCEDDSCISVTGKLKVPYKVATNINLPTVPANLTECQQERVSTAINTTLMAHEKQHVKAFETFNGTASLTINYNGCSDNYVSYQEGLAEAEFERRKTAADAKSAKLDPFSVSVDLCCKDKPKK